MITVRPVRFTDRVQAVADFLTCLEQLPAIVGTSGRWIDLVGEQGHVAVHDAASAQTGACGGCTELSFVVSDADAAADAFRDAGLAGVTVWDEAYGRVVGVDDPHGVRLWFDEAQRDLHGYRAMAPREGSSVSCCPVVFTPDVEAYVHFLQRVGLQVRADHGDYVAMEMPGGGGLVGVHRDASRRVELAFVASGELTGLLDRLRAQGHDAFLDDDPQAGPKLVVTDPDDSRLEVHLA